MNKFLTKVVSICASLALCISMVPVASIATLKSAYAADTNIKYVSTTDEFMDALNNASAGDVIDLQNNEITTPQLSDDTPLVNKVALTIQNAKISVSHAGIVLGAKLTLKNVQLTFRNTVRNGIFANGYSLDLENVTRLGGNGLNIHVVLGQIINSANDGKKADSYIPTRGYNQEVTIRGSNDLGKIILGQFDDSPNGESSTANWYYSGTNLKIDSSCTKVSDTAENRVIYACGAYEPRGEGKGDEITPVPNKYGVSSMSQYINLYGSTINTVYGDTGANSKTIVNYYGGENLTDSVTLDTIRALYVKSGAFQIKENSGSNILAGGQQELGVDAGATLIAGALGDKSIYSFSGGGTLALGTTSNLKQSLSVTNAVTGTTKVVYGNTMNFFNLNTPIADYVYINSPKSGADAFTSEGGPSGAVWTRNAEGGWLWSTTGEVAHEHSFEWQSISDTQHAFVCTDPGCPDADKGQWNESDHDYDTESDRTCPTCGYQRIIIKDIFTPKDSSKYEQFKARLYNKLLQCETTIDVSDIGIKPEEIVYTSINGQTFASGAISIYSMIRFHSLFSTNCTTGQPSLELNSDGTIKTVNVTYSTYTWSRQIVSEFEEQYEKAMNSISGLTDEFQIALTLHEWLCDHVNYGLSVQYADFALGAIKNGAAVCAGYSYAYQFLCEQAGLECKYVAGNTVNLLSGQKEIISHAWNKVRIQGYWFWVDTTWDGSQEATGHSFCLLNDEEWKTAGSGGHANDVITQTNEPPANTNAYFKNKFWEGKTGVLTAAEISQDPQLTIDCEHTWDAGVVTTEPKCETKGVKTYTCTSCKATKTEEIDAKGHSWNEGEITTKPTCQATGIKTFSCTACSETKTEPVAKDANAHNIVEVAEKAATCTEVGWNAYSYCNIEGCTYQRVAKVEIPAHGHKLEDISGTATNASCTEAGKHADKICSACKDESTKVTGDTINPLGHEYGEDGKCTRCSAEKPKDPCKHETTEVEKTKEATCTEPGSHDLLCTKCYEYTERNIVDKALGHDYKSADNKVDATCVAAGHEADEVCSRCNDRIAGAEIPATGKHTYVEGKCTGCGAKEEIKTETFKPSISISNGANVTLDKTEYKEGESAELTFKGESVGTNVSLIKSIKVDGIVVAGQDSLIDKSKWASTNSEYQRRMKESATSVSYDDVLANLVAGGRFEIKNLTATTQIEVEYEELVPVYRLYNMITSEHLFTTDKVEYDQWVAKSKTDTDFWLGEGINWFAPKESLTTVTRLYNPDLGAMGRTSHYYTTNPDEIAELTGKYGWIDESTQGKCFFSGGDIPIWTCYNEALGSAHHYTSSKTEWSGLNVHGWDLEESKNGSNGVFQATLSAVS